MTEFITVTGPIAASAAGITMAHDHVFCVQPLVSEYDHAPEGQHRGVADREMAELPVSMDNLWWIRQNWLSNRDNLVVDEEDVAIAELCRYRDAGGGTLIDPSLEGIGRDPLALARVSLATGVNIVVGAGFYVEETHPAWLARSGIDVIAERIVADIRDGIDDTGVRAGLIGEIGCTWPLRDGERRVLEAAALAQRETGAALMVHPGRDPGSPFEIAEHLIAVGADMERVIVAHLDRTLPDPIGLERLAATGVYLEFDLFGMETSMYPYFWTGIDLLSDAQRLDLLTEMLAAGLGHRVLVGHDICTKHRLARYGGHGYDHIVRNVVPWMGRRGIPDEAVKAILVSNPAAAFAVG